MTISTSPAFPVAGQAVTVTSTLNDTGVRAVQIVLEITSVPPTSAHPTGLVQLDSATAATSAAEIAERDLDSNVFTPDVPGAYGVVVHHYIDAPALPSIRGLDSTRKFKLKDSESGTVHVGARMSLPIVSELGDGATLQIDVVNTTVRAASLADHTTEKARIAALQTTVTAALAALVGVAVASVGTDLQTGTNELLTKYEAHRVLLSSVHRAVDDVNVTKYSAANSQDGAIALLNQLRTVLVRHMDFGLGFGSNATHDVDDRKNVPLIGPAQSLAQATVLLADLRERVYERHRVQIASPASHGAADNTNTLAAPSKLDDAIVAYLDALAALDPTAPTGESEGAQDVIHRFGFLKVTL